MCDYARRPYSTVCKPFPDSPLLVEQVWYPAAPGAKHLEHPSAFMSRDWVPDFAEVTGPGEVFDTPRTYNGRTAIPGALGNHVCGTAEQFAGHAVYDPNVDVRYNRDGLPLCCGVDAEPVGGAVVGGSAVVGYTPSAFTPGTNCSDAPLISFDTPYRFPLAVGQTVWFRYSPASIATSFRVLEGADYFLSIASYFGVCPSGLVNDSVSPHLPDGVTVNTLAPGDHWCTFRNDTGAATTVQFVMNNGPW